NAYAPDSSVTVDCVPCSDADRTLTVTLASLSPLPFTTTPVSDAVVCAHNVTQTTDRRTATIALICIVLSCQSSRKIGRRFSMPCTRRQFLEAVGRAGGAAAAYEAMTALGVLRRPSAFAGIPDLPPGDGSLIIILRSDLAGL